MSDQKFFRPLTAVMLLVALAACERPKPVETVQAPAADAPGCDIARAYVAARLARVQDKTSILVDVAAPGVSTLANMSSARLIAKYDVTQPDPFGWPKDAPSAALVEHWLAATQASPFAACKDFSAVITTAGVSVGTVPATEKPRKDGSERTQMNFAVPVASADGNEALAMESGRAGQGSQVTLLVHLRKMDGMWAEADALVLEMK